MYPQSLDCVSRWNSTSRFRRLKSAATKNRIMTQPLGGQGKGEGEKIEHYELLVLLFDFNFLI